MTRRARVIATILLTAGCSPLLLGASFAFAQGKAADTDGANLGGTGGCNAGNQFDASLPKGQTDKQGKPGLIGLGCKDPKTGQLGICDASGACQAVGEKGAPTAQQKADANNGNSADGAGAAAPSGGSSSADSGSSDGGSGASGAPPQVTPAQPISEPEVLNPPAAAQTAGSTPTSAGGDTAQPSQSAQTTLSNLVGQMTPDQTVAQMFMGPSESAAPSQPTDVSQPSLLTDATQSLQPTDVPQSSGFSPENGASPNTLSSEVSPTYEPGSLPFTETSPMGSLQDINSADIQAANANSQLTPSEQTAQATVEATQNAQNVTAVQNGASTFGQSAAEYLNGTEPSDVRATIYTPGAGDPAMEGGAYGSHGNYLDPSVPTVAAGYNSGLSYGDVVNVSNPATGQAINAVVGDVCPACNTGVDLTPITAQDVGLTTEEGHTPVEVAVVGQATTYAGASQIAAQLNSPSVWTGENSGGFGNPGTIASTIDPGPDIQDFPASASAQAYANANLPGASPVETAALSQGSGGIGSDFASAENTLSPQTAGENIASAVEPSGEPTTDQAGNQTEAGIWGDQQQNIVDEQLALEDREAQAVDEYAAYQGALAAQEGLTETAQAITEATTPSGLDDGLSETGQAIANETAPSGPGEDQSPALTSSIGPSQSDIDQAYANALANAPQSLQSLQEVEAVKGDFAPNPILSDGPGGIGSDYASQASSPSAPEVAQAPETAQGASLTEQSNPTISDLQPQTSETAQGQTVSEQSNPIISGLEPLQSETAAGTPISETSNPTISGLEPGVPETAQGLPFSEYTNPISTDLSGQNTAVSGPATVENPVVESEIANAPPAETGQAIASEPQVAVTSEPETPETAQSQPFSLTPQQVVSDLTGQSAPLSSGAGGIGSDFASSQDVVPASGGDDSTLASAYENALAESATQNEESQTLADREAQADQETAVYQRDLNDFIGTPNPLGIVESSSIPPADLVGPAPVEPVTSSDLPSIEQGQIFTEASNPVISGLEPMQSETAQGTSFTEASNPVISALEPQSPETAQGSINNSETPNQIVTDLIEQSAPLSYGSGGIGSDFASQANTSGSAPETPQTPQSPQTPTSPEQNPAVENPPLPNARPSTPSNPSIVDFLDSVGQDTSFATRSALAAANGIENYVGSAAQNLKLLQLCFAGTCFK